MAFELEIERREKALLSRRPDYMRCLRLAGEFDYAPLFDVLFNYKAGEPSEKAIFILAQCQMLLHEQWKLLREIKGFDQAEAQLARLKEALPPSDNG